jgi:hypothetical protein
MSKPKTHLDEKVDDINELLGYYEYPTKGETLAAQRGLLSGWLARLATTDYMVAQELEERLYLARQKHSSSKKQS